MKKLLRIFLCSLLLLFLSGVSTSISAQELSIGFDGDPLRFERLLNYHQTYPDVDGFFVKSISQPNSPIVKAGLRTNQIIHSIDGTVVESIPDIRSVLKENIGNTVTVNLYRRSPEYEKRLQDDPFYKSRSAARFTEDEIDVYLREYSSEPVEVFAKPAGVLYHRRGFKHTPPREKAIVFEKRENAESQKLTPCPICFAQEESALTKILEMSRIESQKIVTKFKENFEVTEKIPPSLRKIVEELNTSLTTPDPNLQFMVVQTDRFFGYGLKNGLIVVSEGLLRSLEGDDERAAFLAKMMAHYDRKQDHDKVETQRFRSLIERAVKRTTGVGLEFEDIKDWSPNLPGFSYYQELIEEGYGESQEREAYFYALLYLHRSDYSPAGMDRWITKREDMLDRLHPKWVDYQLVHPLPSDIRKDVETWNERLSKSDNVLK